MIDKSAREAAAAALDEARTTATPIEPPTETWPGFDVDDAYAVQALGIDRRLAAGAAIVGWKVGLTSEAMQRQLGVDEPDFGPLLDRMEVSADATVERSGLISPRIEAELAFRLRAELGGPGIDVAAVAAAVDTVLPALELIDSRVVDWRIQLADTIADHASCSGFVLGGEVPLSAVDLGAVAVAVSRNGEQVEEGIGKAVLGDPLAAVAWVANTIAAYGETLLPGQVILAGALHASIPLAAGDRIEASFSDPAIGSLTVRCH